MNALGTHLRLGLQYGNLRRIFRPLSIWALLALLAHLPWEVAQLPLYQVWLQQKTALIAFDVLHCTVGDVLIAATIYAATATILRQMIWPLRRPWAGGAMYIPSLAGPGKSTSKLIHTYSGPRIRHLTMQLCDGEAK